MRRIIKNCYFRWYSERGEADWNNGFDQPDKQCKDNVMDGVR